MTIRLFACAGSTRKESLNKKLIRVATEIAQEQVEVDLIDLKDYPMPLYDGDLEQQHGIPDNALKIKEKMCQAHGFLLACPEYNSSISAVLKNTIDWVSRPVPNEENLVAFKGKLVGLLSASPGALGGLRNLYHMRQMFLNLGSLVVPTLHAIPKANTVFDEQGRLTDEVHLKNVTQVVQSTVQLSQKLNS